MFDWWFNFFADPTGAQYAYMLLAVAYVAKIGNRRLIRMAHRCGVDCDRHIWIILHEISSIAMVIIFWMLIRITGPMPATSAKLITPYVRNLWAIVSICLFLAAGQDFEILYLLWKDARSKTEPKG